MYVDIYKAKKVKERATSHHHFSHRSPLSLSPIYLYYNNTITVNSSVDCADEME